jgi:hypothetical protein
VTTALEREQPSPVAQWAAAIVTVVIAALLAIGLPRLAAANAPQDTALVGGERITAGGVSIVPAEGWARAAGTDLMVISKGDAKLVIPPPQPSDQTPEEAVAAAEQLATADQSITSTIGEVTPFTTSEGLAAASVAVVQPDFVTVLYAFSDGASLSNGTLFLTPVTWSDLQAEIDTMTATVGFEQGATP